MNPKHGTAAKNGTKTEKEESQSGPGQMGLNTQGPTRSKGKAEQLNPTQRPIKISFVTTLLSPAF